MKNTWPMQTAKAGFGRLIDKSTKDGPQIVARSVPALHELDLSRSKDTGRDIDL
jgi:hypothetical protein